MSLVFDPLDKCVPVSRLSQFQFVSLLDMLRFYARRFLDLNTSLTVFREEFAKVGKDYPGEMIQEPWPELLKPLAELESICGGLELKLSLIQIERIRHAIEKRTVNFADLATVIMVLQVRIADEISSVLLLAVPDNKAKYYQELNLFGDEVATNFPSAAFDIEEASKCFALGRSTACVMHLMRIIEIGLKVVAKELGVAEAELLPTWQAVISKIEAQMRIAANKRGSDWLKVEPFYREIPAHLFAIKNAWRNPSMHVQTSYDEERALDVYNAVRGFMRYLATELKE